jgi:hypothetical protein
MNGKNTKVDMEELRVEEFCMWGLQVRESMVWGREGGAGCRTTCRTWQVL